MTTMAPSRTPQPAIEIGKAIISTTGGTRIRQSNREIPRSSEDPRTKTANAKFACMAIDTAIAERPIRLVSISRQPPAKASTQRTRVQRGRRRANRSRKHSAAIPASPPSETSTKAARNSARGTSGRSHANMAAVMRNTTDSPSTRSITTLVTAVRGSMPARWASHMRTASPPTLEGRTWLKNNPMATIRSAPPRPIARPRTPSTQRQRTAAGKHIPPMRQIATAKAKMPMPVT